MLTRRLIGVTLAASASLVLAAAVPAAADPAYTTTTHTDTTGVELIAGATATVEADGLRLTTPAAPDKATFSVDVFDEAAFASGDTVPAILLTAIQELSYKTIKHDATGNSTLPAYKLEIMCDEAHPYSTLVFEPYQQTPAPAAGDLDEWQTWDVDAGTFWSSKDLGDSYGGPGDQSDQRDLEDVLALCPYAIVLSYQVGQGSVNPGVDATTDAVRFAATAYPLAAETDKTEEKVAAAVVSDAAVVLGTPIADEHIWRKPADPVITLPQTGTSVTWYVLIGAALVLLGGLTVLLTRRRRTA